jgi:hypothetical protein
LSLERVDAGVRFAWDKMKPNISTDPPPPMPARLGDVGDLTGKYPWDFMHVQEIDRRLHALLGQRYEDFQNDISTQTPIEKNGSLLVMRGMFPHTGLLLSAGLVYDTKTNLLCAYIADKMANDESQRRVDAFSEDWTRAPAVFEAELRERAEGRPIVRH